MNHPLAIFYHVKLSNADPVIHFEKAIAIMAEQILALEKSGLSKSASYFFVGVNGDWQDWASAKAIAPDKAHVVQHPEGSRGEHPTMRAMQLWCRENPGAYVYYQHTKSVTRPDDPTAKAWLKCMTGHLVSNWQQCVKDLDSGLDMVGCHWITKEKYPFAPVAPYWGGNFLWSTAKFIKTLPLIAPTAVEFLHKYDAEVLVARGNQPARVRDYAPHFPGAKCLEAMRE